jgi:hypothetical protein
MTKSKPINDAYTVILSIAFSAITLSCLLLYYNLRSYPVLAQ